MKFYLFLILTMFLSFWAQCQKIDYDKIILPGSDLEFNEKLVQIAWNNHPINNIARKTVKLAKYNHKQAIGQWFDIVEFQLNYNEFTLNPSTDVLNRSAYYPRYNIALRIPLGMFITQPMITKRGKEEINISEEEVNARKIQVREEVLKSYNMYLMYREIYNIQNLALTDTESSHQVIENAFRNGEESFDIYINSLNALNRIKIENIKAETDYLNAKLDLEAKIGISLEDIY